MSDIPISAILIILVMAASGFGLARLMLRSGKRKQWIGTIVVAIIICAALGASVFLQVGHWSRIMFQLFGLQLLLPWIIGGLLGAMTLRTVGSEDE